MKDRGKPINTFPPFCLSQQCRLSQQFLLECTQSGFRSQVTHTVLVLHLKFLLSFWTETTFGQTTVSSTLLHRNCIILPVEPPGIHINSRPGWRSARLTRKTFSFHQMEFSARKSWCLLHFLQNGEGI